MIAKMRKLNLAALSYDRDGILNALERTNAVEVREHAEAEGTFAVEASGEELRSYLATLENALEVLLAASAGKGKDKNPALKDGFSVAYTEFATAGEKREEIDALVRQIGELVEEKSASQAEQVRLTRAIAAAKPYAKVRQPFSAYTDTLHTRTCLGVLPSAAYDAFEAALAEHPLIVCDAVKDEESVLLTVIFHKSAAAEAESLLSAAGFSSCPYEGDITGSQQFHTLKNELVVEQKRQRALEKSLASLSTHIRDLKIYCDYIGFQLEKAETAGKLRSTERTFFLEAYVPAEAEESVKTVLDSVTAAIWYEFSDPAEDEQVPTLLKNNPVVKNFELVTNMYSPPNAREIDPNTVMSFFYSLFLGFIMADIGYGLMMLLGGGLLYFKSRQGGLKSLSGVFAVGGIFAIIWGFLFNSLLGITILPFTVMPNVQTEMYTIMGIGLPAVLVISLMLGVVQLMAGYLCKAAQSWRWGTFWDGVFDGVVWAVFSIGVEIALIGLVEEFALPFLVTAGGIIAGASLVVAVFTAGRKQKFFGKISKGFSSLYGLINYFSDVLSYLRLYALMLTGAIIAQVVSDYSVQFMTSGSAFIILGVALMVVGHVFNLAIGLLGAYIHTARLQYIEFFGKFYVGDGELFTPLGSQKKYINLEQKTV